MDYQSLGGKEFLLFRYLLKNNKTDIKSIDEHLSLSHVSIRLALDEIDSFLEKNGIKKLERSKGKIFLDLESLKELKVECSYFNSGRERFNYILAKFIFNEIISVNSLVEELNVTRKTLDSDLRKIKKFIEGYGLKISTKLWNGTSIEGDFEDRYRLAVDFVASVSIFKELNSDFYRIFQLEKNNIVYRELRNHISRRENEEAEKFMLELFQELNYAGNIYFYYIGVAMVLVGKIYGVEIRGLGLSSERKELIRQESQKKEVKKTIEIIENILKNYPKLSFSREEIENFIYFMTFIDLKNRNITEETEKFIQEIEEYYDTISIPDLKANLQCMINYFKYKSKYNLTNYLPKIEHFPEKYREIAQEMRPIYQKYFGDIFEEDLYLLIHFYRDVIYKNHLEKNCKNVFIIDSTPNNHKGELVAEELEKNYLVGKIKIVSIFSKIDWEEVNRDYDMIFCLNDQDVSKYTEKSKIVIHSIFGTEMIKDRYFFNGFNIKTKSGEAFIHVKKK